MTDNVGRPAISEIRSYCLIRTPAPRASANRRHWVHLDERRASYEKMREKILEDAKKVFRLISQRLDDSSFLDR